MNGHTLAETAARLDFASELEAIARGECALCRIGARHRAGSTCPGARAIGDHWCARGKHDVPTHVVGGLIIRRGVCAHCGAEVL